MFDDEPTKERGTRLEHVTISRNGNWWVVTRERRSSGESAKVKTLTEAWEYVMAAYDLDGELICQNQE